MLVPTIFVVCSRPRALAVLVGLVVVVATDVDHLVAVGRPTLSSELLWRIWKSSLLGLNDIPSLQHVLRV